MTYENPPDPKPATRLVKVLIALATIVLAGFVIVGGASYWDARSVWQSATKTVVPRHL
jgi:TRAP-type C4-dicarboxylate transport system permease small subunit